ncbi:hypothetical protein [Nocardia ninae]|nr:hypothetical protein [Nocardia ninae]
MQPFRWWQLPGRALFYLPLSGGGLDTVYAVDVRHWQNQSSGGVKADLFLDGRHHAESKLPAAFPVAGGRIEVAMSRFGLKRCHYVTVDGSEHQLIPDRKSAEGRRAHLDRRYPLLSRSIGLLSVVMLLVGVALLVNQLAEPISRIPPIAERIGVIETPIDLPGWAIVGLGFGAVLASVERSLRMRYHWLLDAAGN